MIIKVRHGDLLEYNRYSYPSFGKKYNNEKAVISLTSWTARINTVIKTIDSLIQQCPNFHIVLVLAEEEFPRLITDLPGNLLSLIDNKLIEIMFVKKNYRSFKKILFTMDKYRNVPIISADDDCIYTCNYAQELYDEWLRNKTCVISMGSGANGGSKKLPPYPTGSKSLYPPYCFKDFWKPYIYEISEKTNDDDTFYAFMLNNIFNIKIHSDQPYKDVYVFHDEIKPMHEDLSKYGYENAVKWIKTIIKL